LRFLVDAQLPPSLAVWLAAKGHQAEHVIDLGALDAPDAVIWDTALTTGAVIVSKDRDFVDWARTRKPKVRIVWIRFGNMHRDVLQASLEAVWSQVEDALASDVTVIEVGR
jgi:predicted nuclease of predicted toxin-antitoxin system